MKLPPFTKTSILCGIILFIGLQRGGGTAAVLLVPILLACMLYAVVRLVWKKAERRTRAIQLAAWAGTFALVMAAQAYWSTAAREKADAAAAAVLAHRQKTGAYPASLAQAGLDEKSLTLDWRMRYRLLDGKPDLAYPHQTMMMSSHEYDFESRRWSLNAY